MSGFWARHYKANGFFAVNVTGYTFTHLVASLGGEYGIYAFKSKGGTMSYDEGYYNNDAGFYIGGTPPQTKPLRSTVSHDKSWGNVIGFSGTNVRYTTITKSDFYNNGTGISSNAATSEPYTGPAHNTIIGNRIFWNNFNFRKGAPFSLAGTSIGTVPYPQGDRDHPVRRPRQHLRVQPVLRELAGRGRAAEPVPPVDAVPGQAGRQGRRPPSTATRSRTTRSGAAGPT